MWSKIMRKAPQSPIRTITQSLFSDWLPYVVRLALAHFPIEQFDWIKQNTLQDELSRLDRLL